MRSPLHRAPLCTQSRPGPAPPAPLLHPLWARVTRKRRKRRLAWWTGGHGVPPRVWRAGSASCTQYGAAARRRMERVFQQRRCCTARQSTAPIPALLRESAGRGRWTRRRTPRRWRHCPRQYPTSPRWKAKVPAPRVPLPACSPTRAAWYRYWLRAVCVWGRGKGEGQRANGAAACGGGWCVGVVLARFSLCPRALHARFKLDNKLSIEKAVFRQTEAT